MSSCRQLSVFPGIDQPIAKAILQAIVANDQSNSSTSSRTIMYAVRQPPINGRLRLATSTALDGNLNADVTSFTQAEIDAGRIVYRSTVTSLPAWEDALEDRIVFDVSTAYADGLRNVTVMVNVSYNNVNADNLASLVSVGRLLVEEGGAVTLTKSQLDATPLIRRLSGLGNNVDVGFTVIGAPMHGRLAVAGGSNATEGYRLSQRDVSRNVVVYVHDGTETTHDCVRLELEVTGLFMGDVSAEGGRRALNYVIDLNVTIQSVDDQPFELMTQSPEVTVLQGDSAIIGPEVLLTVDKDTPPERVVYEVSEAASNGHLVNRGTNETIEKFSQKDVNERKIIFVQDGSRDSGAFYFKVRS